MDVLQPCHPECLNAESCSCTVGQACRDCGELFPYDPDADTCPACLAELGVTVEDVARHAAMDRGEVSA